MEKEKLKEALSELLDVSSFENQEKSRAFGSLSEMHVYQYVYFKSETVL